MQLGFLVTITQNVNKGTYSRRDVYVEKLRCQVLKVKYFPTTGRGEVIRNWNKLEVVS